MSASPRRQRLRRGAYLLPTLFTVGNMVLGFAAILAGLHGSFGRAGVFLILAAVLDALDGRIARLSGTESEFGKQFDTLADVLTFGAAPALLAYLWGLETLGRPGWLVPAAYLISTAARLARFNIQTRSTDSRYFVGLPCPVAATAVAAFLSLVRRQAGSEGFSLVLLGLMAALAVLMVTTFRYRSFKELDLRRRWSYRAVLLLAVALLLIGHDPPTFLALACAVYILSGPVAWVGGRWLRPAAWRSRTREADQ